MLNNIDLLEKYDNSIDISKLRQDSEINLYIEGYYIFKKTGRFVFDSDLEVIEEYINNACKGRLNIIIMRTEIKPNGINVSNCNFKKCEELLPKGYELINIIDRGEFPVIEVKHNIKAGSREFRILYDCLCMARRKMMNDINELMEMVGF